MRTTRSQLEQVSSGEESDPAREAVMVAETLLRRALETTTPAEIARMARVTRLIENPEARRLSLLMTDRLGRSCDDRRMAERWRDLIRRCDGGAGFGTMDRWLLRLGALGSRIFPGWVMNQVRARLRAESREVILDADDGALADHLAARATSGARVNVNLLGEAVMGEEETRRRLAHLQDLLRRDDLEQISVKISAVYSQIHLVAWRESVEAIKERLRALFRVAAEQEKFVNLDMEAYRDLDLTLGAFREVLAEKEFFSLSAGMALQAYLPDSVKAQCELTAWARDRVARGGAPVKIRLVKGANLAMERVEAEIRGWTPAPFQTKHETDACFKRMLEFGCLPENARCVSLGIGSHNLFDVALALVLREQNGVREAVEIEMLEGMSPAQSRAVESRAGGVLYYAPVVGREEWENALAYLIRRFDENTEPDHFLANLFSLRPGSPEWEDQRDRFTAAWKGRQAVDLKSRRASLPAVSGESFANQPDTDWTQAEHRARLESVEACQESPPRSEIPEIEEALAGTAAAQPHWEARGEGERAGILRACAEQLASTRFESIALMREEGKKAVAEVDPEVSEAIDFARYYAATGKLSPGTVARARGVVVVAPPWNFPLAIPCGGVLAALMAGNAVILKPAPETVRLGWWLVRQLWEAGVPREVLAFVACEDGAVGRRLIEDSRCLAVILTGAYETAQKFREWRPSLPLFAETSGKNALVVSATADREEAVRDLVKSAFGHAGQKCSAASLGILESEVYQDPVFRRQLRDVAASLWVGEARDPRSVVTPLIRPPDEKLRRALTTLDDGEEWLLQPEVSSQNACLWSPGIKLGVRPGSWFHHTECFGPVLGLMESADLEEALVLQNAVSFGLTAGLQALDEREISGWKARVEAGNLYINRPITGAIVQRQSFGGWKRSAVGPGAKAGGPNYVSLFRRFEDRIGPSERESVLESYRDAWNQHFSREHDPTGLISERNVFRYRPAKGVLLRLERKESLMEEIAGMAAEICGVRLEISRAEEEPDEDLAGRLPALAGKIEFLRTLGAAPGDAVLIAAARTDVNWIDAPLSPSGRVELTRWTREQAISETRHRHGNPME